MKILIQECDNGFQYAGDHIPTASWRARKYYGAYIKDTCQTLIGIVGVRLSNKFCHEVCHLYVDEKHRRKGIGFSLMDKVECMYRDVWLCATVSDGNIPSLKLFLKKGWNIQCKRTFPSYKNMVYVLHKEVIYGDEYPME